MPRIFSSNFVLKAVGTLYVFQGFYKKKLEQKGGHIGERLFLEVLYHYWISTLYHTGIRKAVYIKRGAIHSYG